MAKRTLGNEDWYDWLALGDHLHFGVLVQGIEVRPEEWMDKKWIRNNIDNVFKEASSIIEGK